MCVHHYISIIFIHKVNGIEEEKARVNESTHLSNIASTSGTVPSSSMTNISYI